MKSPIEKWREATKEVVTRAHKAPYGDPDVGGVDDYNYMQAIATATAELLREVSAKGHGGGNWRRLLEIAASELVADTLTKGEKQ